MTELKASGPEMASGEESTNPGRASTVEYSLPQPRHHRSVRGFSEPPSQQASISGIDISSWLLSNDDTFLRRNLPQFLKQQHKSTDRSVITSEILKFLSSCIERPSGFTASANSVTSTTGRTSGGSLNLSQSKHIDLPGTFHHIQRGSLPAFEDGGKDKKKQQKEGGDERGSKYQERKLACFFIKKPSMRSPSNVDRKRSRACFGPGFDNIPRLKEHLYRCHLAPIYCFRCQLVFGSDQQLRDHLNQAVRCEQRAPKYIDCITKDQEKFLRNRSHFRGQTDAQKWKGYYKIICPTETDIPSPYHDNFTLTGNDLKKDSPPKEISSLFDYCQKHLPSILEMNLKKTSSERHPHLSEEYRDILISVVESSLSLVWSQYIAEHGPDQECTSNIITEDRKEVHRQVAVTQDEASHEPNIHNRSPGPNGSVFPVLESPLLALASTNIMDIFGSGNPTEFGYSLHGGEDSHSWPEHDIFADMGLDSENHDTV